MADIFNEIDEDLRKDRAKQVWQKYGKKFIAGAIVIVIAVSGFTAYQYWNMQQIYDSGARYSGVVSKLALGGENAAQGLNMLEAANQLQALQGLKAGFSPLADATAAALYVQEGAFQQAYDLYESLAQNTDISEFLRQQFHLLSLETAMAGGLMDAAAIQTNLDAFYNDVQALKDPALAGLSQYARLFGVELALSQGQTIQAKEMLTQLTNDQSTLPDITNMAQEILDLLDQQAKG
ncbi:MAG: tetratricopeptide repeat protein [Alphaproteobacteria bacterium]